MKKPSRLQRMNKKRRLKRYWRESLMDGSFFKRRYTTSSMTGPAWEGGPLLERMIFWNGNPLITRELFQCDNPGYYISVNLKDSEPKL